MNVLGCSSAFSAKAFRLYLETSCIAFRVRQKGEAAKKRSNVKSKRYRVRWYVADIYLFVVSHLRMMIGVRYIGT